MRVSFVPERGTMRESRAFTVQFAGSRDLIPCYDGRSIPLNRVRSTFASERVRYPAYNEVCIVGNATVGLEDKGYDLH